VSPREEARRIIRIRRAVQAASLLLFLALLLAARAPENGRAPRGVLGLYFDFDPLVLLSNALSTKTVAGLSLWALLTLLVTVLLGRVFCGWICPFGVVHQFATWARARRSRRPAASAAFSPWQRAKYALLFALLVMSLLGAHWIGVFDPASLLYRSVTTVVLPSTQLIVDGGAGAAFRGDPHVGPLHLTRITEPVYRFFKLHVFHGRKQVFTGGFLVFAVFVAAVGLNLWRPRFWCRYVCPLGALLGLFARRTSLRLAAGERDCTDCGLCTLACPAAAQPEKPGRWLPDECFGCWNCVAACHREAIRFRFEWPWKRPAAGSVDLTRRAVAASLAGGIGGLLLLRIAPQAQGRAYHPALIRPPGSLAEREFLARCIQCGFCMKACPTNALHPTLAEAGLEGVWTPVLVPRLGYCEFGCRLCGLVCPTGAIQPLDLAAKQKVKIGLATIDTTRCLPYAYDRECIVCEEHCPIPTKAITFVMAPIVRRDGTSATIKQPRVDPDLCTGCGICETKCPFADRAAIRVTSANEDRHPGNRPFLAGFGG
jgi:MauM/NapG family ferredoxin protein